MLEIYVQTNKKYVAYPVKIVNGIKSRVRWAQTTAGVKIEHFIILTM